MIDRILVICLGNICRSPMAEGILRHSLPGRTIFSAGIRALVGFPADPNSIAIMQEQGIDISGHRAQQLTDRLIASADLVLTMEKEQTRFIESSYSTARGKVMRLGEFGKYDIADPYRQGIESFRLSHRLIEQGVEDLKSRILKIN